MVAQLAERLLLTSEVQGLNPDQQNIKSNLYLLVTVEKMKIKTKERNGSIISNCIKENNTLVGRLNIICCTRNKSCEFPNRVFSFRQSLIQPSRPFLICNCINSTARAESNYLKNK